MALAQETQPTPTTAQRAEQFHEERRYIVRSPVPSYFAFLVALALLPLGVLGFIPQLTAGAVLLGLIRQSPLMSAIYLVTSLAGFAAFVIRRGHYAHLFTLVITGLYLVIFSSGNIAFGNLEGLSGGPPDFPWIIENALHAGLMLTGALITGLAALQHGDRATAREFKERYGISDPHYRSASGIWSFKRTLSGLKEGSLLHKTEDRLRHTALLTALYLAVMAVYTAVAVVLHRHDGSPQRGGDHRDEGAA